MKKCILIPAALLFSCAIGSLSAQNKTLGVGASTPNPNAALHVESPTSNQGFIMPRLTTAQRTAMSALLTVTDNGLMLYDTDQKTVYIWDGTIWKSTADVAGGARLSYPYKDSVVTGTGTTDLFALKYNNPEHKRVMRIENLSRTNGSSALSVSNNGSGLAGYFQNKNDTTSSSALYATINSNYVTTGLAPVAIYGESTGTGALASSFRINNPANPYPAVWAETNGTGPTLQGNQLGTGAAIVAQVANDTSTAASVFATTVGPGRAAHFTKTGTTGGSAVLIESEGGGALFANNNGATGLAGVIQNINTSNGSPGVYIEAVGPGTSLWTGKSVDAVSGDAFAAFNEIASGGAARFETINAANADNTVITTTAGPGAAIYAENSNATQGFAGLFRNSNAGNTFPALQAENEGSGPGLAVYQNPTGTGTGIHLHMQNASGVSPAMSINHDGLGNGIWMQSTNASNTSAVLNATNSGMAPAAHLEVNNPGSGSAAVFATTNGTGAAIQANTSTGFTSIYGRREGATNGNAGYFEITDAANTYPALQINNIGPGSSINSIHTGANGDAIYAEVQGNGSAGNFNVNNAANIAAAVWVSTNATGGNGVGINHTANGRGLSFMAGGMQVSTVTLTGGGTITQRAIAYAVDGNTYSFDAGFTFAEGDIFYVFNTDGVQSATVAGTLISSNSGKVFMYLAGALRAF